MSWDSDSIWLEYELLTIMICCLDGKIALQVLFLKKKTKLSIIFNIKSHCFRLKDEELSPP